MFTVNFYRVGDLAPNVKRKAGFPYSAQLTTQMVRNGNGGNFTLHNPNSFDVNHNMETLATFDYCDIVVGGFRQINIITGLTYVNNNCTTVNFKVDYFSTAVASGLITSCTGFLERTFLDYDNPASFVNLLSEPFSVNMIERVAENTTTIFSNYINTFTGQSSFDLLNPFEDCYIVVIVSSFLSTYANLSDWQVNPSSPLGLIELPELPSIDSRIVAHSGGFYNGVPICFDNFEMAQNWITRVLNNNCGFETKMDENGVIENELCSFAQLPNATNGYTYSESIGNITELPVHAVRLVRSSDIIDCQVIPKAFCEPRYLPLTQGENGEDFIDLPHDLTNIHGLGPEPNRNSKVLSFPFTQYSINTAFGDSIDLIPQVYNQREDIWSNDFKLQVALKYIGGTSPRLMLWVNKALSDLPPFGRSNQGTWLTIRCFPSIPIKTDGTLNQANLFELENSRKIQTNKQHLLQGSVNQSPFRAGLRGNTNTNAGTGFGRNVLNTLGGGINSLTGGFTSDVMGQPEELTANQQIESATAGNIAGSSFDVISTGGNFQQMMLPNVTFSSKCATNSEQWAVCRFFDRHGQSASGVINPFASSNTIFGGRGIVTQIDGREYYVMSNVIVNCNLPQIYRDAISDFFSLGGYLIV
jgi:hypothetical protein